LENCEAESEHRLQSLTWQKKGKHCCLVVPVMLRSLHQGCSSSLRDASQALPEFNNEMRKAAEQVAQHVVDRARCQRKRASTARQSPEKARRVILRRSRWREGCVLDATASRPSSWIRKRGFVSASRPNRRRKQQGHSMGSVFFGAEFGGRRRPTTQAILYVIVAVRATSSGRPSGTANRSLSSEYSDAIERVLKNLAQGAE
jgi:Ni/Co efflux regulator RcnB